MNTLKSLTPVTNVDKEKCCNCHRCIAVCPVKLCNDGSCDYVTLDSNLCIGCGSCIDACTHRARTGIDDTQLFLNELKKDSPIIAIVAPAVAVNFKGRDLELNGWLKSAGVKAVFDVSFGAELTTKTYVEQLKNKNPLA
ncbi:MAG: 4Fe-4S binding protein [Treponema sp.]|nr:4Fe-4S binding protein [Treponema sp.]